MTEKRRQKIEEALVRLTGFRRWFVTIPAKGVRLSEWYWQEKGNDHVAPARRVTECGAVGCLGGWLRHSTMFRKYIGPSFQDFMGYHKELHAFMGSQLINLSNETYPIFAGRRDYSRSERDEAVLRIDNRIAKLKLLLA